MQFEIEYLPRPKYSQTLVWHQGQLIQDNPYRLSLEKFDAALPYEQDWSISYKRLCTKALLFRNNFLNQEIDRSYYHAEVTEYPIALFSHENRVLYATTPEDYHRLHFFDCETKACLTDRDTESRDYFHSRLAISPDREWIISAGWVWHPFQVVQIYSIKNVIADPRLLDQFDIDSSLYQIFDLESDVDAAFDENNRLIIALSEPGTGITRIHTYNPRIKIIESFVESSVPAGSLMPVGSDHVLVFADCPRLVDLRDGQVLHAWPEIRTNVGAGCLGYIGQTEKRPQLVLDMPGRRFAVEDGDRIIVVRL